MKTNKILSNKYLRGTLLVLAGILIGWLIFHSPKPSETTEVHEHSEAEQTVWTCSMHPQIRMDKPGKCPICGMDLIPLKSTDAEIDDQAIKMSESAVKLAEVQTSVVTRGATSKEILLYGKIRVDEQLKQSQTANVPGRIEKLMVNTTGETVKKGQSVATIYSPELVTAQKELLEALSLKDKYPSLVEAAREKLRNWKLTEEQIADIEKSGNVTSNFDIFATTSGVVVNLKVNTGDYISKGSVLFDVTGLSKVWGVFDAYESDLPWISLNQQVDFTTQSVPGKTFSGKITFIDPVIDPVKRTAGVRIELDNSSGQLKPEMFINGIIHPGLKNGSEDLTIPQSAVLWTGTRSVVYVKVPGAEQPTFKMREVTLGAATKDNFVVTDGLNEGEEIVTNGAFSVDAAAQLAGKPSMMNPSGSKITSTMPGMDMPGDSKPEDNQSMPGMDMGTDPGNDSSMNMPANGTSAQQKTQTKQMSKMGSPASETLTSKSVKVSGNCEMCKDRIEKAAKSVAGVSFADWSPETKILQVKYDQTKTNSAEIQKAIAKTGHDTEKYKAPNDVYNALPECCLYRK